MVIYGYQQQTDQSPHYDIEEIEKIEKLLMETPSCRIPIPPGETSPAKTPPTIEDLIKQIHIGMSESELVASLRPGSLDSGTIYWGGTGARRIYFHIAPAKQIWFEISGGSGSPKFGKVVLIGPVEPKTKWTLHGGDSITPAITEFIIPCRFENPLHLNAPTGNPVP